MTSSFNDLRGQARGHRTSHTEQTAKGQPNYGPLEQRTGTFDPPFGGGGRHAELPAPDEFWECADDPTDEQGYFGNLKRTERQNAENVGDMRSGYPLRNKHGPNT